jgi:chromosome segregation ATPase
MADVTGTFRADFTPFLDAVNKAEVELRSFEDDANKVGDSLSRMTNRFSGQKLIQDAALMVEAIERIGGAAKLTEKELAEVSAKAAEASEKMRALGMDVPAGLDKLAGAAKKVGEETKTAGQSAGVTTSLFNGLAGQLAGMFTVGAVLNFGKGILDLADEVQKLQAQTGMTADEVQRLQAAAAGSSVPLGTLVKASQDLTLALGTDNAGVIAGLKNLGINVEAFKRLNAYEQMRELARAIGEIEDPTERATRAQQVLEKTWREALPAMNEEFGKVGDAAWTMSDDSSKAIDGFVDDLGTMYKNAKVIVGEVAGFFITAKNAVVDFAATKLPDWMQPGTSMSIAASWGQFWNLMDGGAKDLQATLDKAAPPIKPYSDFKAALADTALSGRELAEVQRQLDKENTESIAANKRAAEEAKKRAEAEAEALKKWAEGFEEVNEYARPVQATIDDIDASLVSHIQKLLEGGASVEKLAAAYSLTVPQVKAIKTALDELTEAKELQKAADEELTQLGLDLYESQAVGAKSATDRQIAEIQRWATDYKAKLAEMKIGTTEHYAAIDAIAAQRIQNMMVNWGELKTGSIQSLEETRDRAVATYNEAITHSDRYSASAIQNAENQARAAQDAVDQYAGNLLIIGQASADTANTIVGHAQRAALSWSEAMEAVRQGQGTMSGTLPAGGPGTMTNYGPWGSPGHIARVQRQFAEGRYFGPVVHGEGNASMPGYGGRPMNPDWEALGITPPAGAFTWDQLNPFLNAMPSPAQIVGGGAAYSSTYNNTFNVNGTGQDVARTVSEELTRMMRTGRKWPAV